MSGTRVTCTDLATGESDSIEIRDNYVLVTDGRCEVTHEQRFANGTVQLTIKRPIGSRAREPEAVPPTEGTGH